MFIRPNGSTILSEKLYSSFSHSIFYSSMRTLFAEQQYLSIASKQFVEMIQLTGDGDAAVFNAIHTNIFSMKKIQELNANTVFLEPCYPVPGSTKSSFRNNLQYFKLNKKQDRISLSKGWKKLKRKCIN